MAEYRRFKAINFDLSSERLREVFGEKGRRKAYAQIESFLRKEGYTHRQWSGYISQRPKSNLEVFYCIDGLARQHRWLDHCVNRFDVTNVTGQSDMIDIISNAASDTRIYYTRSSIV
jgi:virulence-associated protein VapD